MLSISPGQRDEFIADTDLSALDNACRDAAKAANSIVAADAEDFFHSGAGMTFPRGFQDGRANLEALVLQTQEIDTARDDVAPEVGRQNF